MFAAHSATQCKVTLFVRQSAALYGALLTVIGLTKHSNYAQRSASVGLVCSLICLLNHNAMQDVGRTYSLRRSAVCKNSYKVGNSDTTGRWFGPVYSDYMLIGWGAGRGGGGRAARLRPA